MRRAWWVLVALAACGNPAEGPGPVFIVIVEPASATMHPGADTQFVATPVDAHGTTLFGKPMLWTSSDTAVATVNPSGFVTAKAPGVTTIGAASEGKQGLAALTVTPAPVAAVVLTPAGAGILAGDTLRFSAQTRDSGGGVLTGRVVTWSSSDTTKATVSGTGLVTAVDSGAVSIIATSEGVEGVAPVTVTLAASIVITPNAASILVDSTVQLRATAFRKNGDSLPGYPVVWDSDDKGVALVSQNGLVTGLSAGTATITAASDSVSQTATITVTLTASAALRRRDALRRGPP